MDTKININPENWVDEHGDFLFNYAMVRLNDIAQSEDIVQETFLSALKNYKNFEGKSTFRTWLVSILKRKIIDHYRKYYNKLDSEKIDDVKSEISEDFQKEGWFKGQWIQERGPSDWGEHPEDALEQKEFLQILKECILGLPKNLASVFSLREMEEYKSEEVCKELNISSSNLWVMLYRARKLLRTCLEKNWFTQE